MFGGFFGGGNNSGDKNNTSSTTTDTLSSSDAPSPFGASSPSTAPLSSFSSSPSDTRSRLQNAIVQQSNLINAKYLIQKINDNCFEHCVAEPGASLSSKERTCLSTCMEKYIDGWNVVSKTYVSRLQKEGAAMQAAAGGFGS